MISNHKCIVNMVFSQKILQNQQSNHKSNLRYVNYITSININCEADLYINKLYLFYVYEPAIYTWYNTLVYITLTLKSVSYKHGVQLIYKSSVSRHPLFKY